MRARAHRQSVGLRTAQDGSEDAEQTRELVDAIVEESGEARDRETESTEGGGPSVSLTDIEHALMDDSEEEEEIWSWPFSSRRGRRRSWFFNRGATTGATGTAALT